MKKLKPYQKVWSVKKARIGDGRLKPVKLTPPPTRDK